jgi:hypothetical protein
MIGLSFVRATCYGRSARHPGDPMRLAIIVLALAALLAVDLIPLFLDAQ